MKQSNIIITITISLIISFSFLFFVQEKQYQIEKNWFLYFNEAKGPSLDFTTENFSKKDTDFQWTLLIDGKEITSGNFEVLKNDKKTVSIEKISEGKTFLIKVKREKEEKEIYKIL
jgi:hypothetical protein